MSLNIFSWCWPYRPILLELTAVVSNLKPITIRGWSLITVRGGNKMGKLRIQNFLCPPPPSLLQDGVTLFTPPILTDGKFLHPPPPSIWLKLQATPLSYHPSAWLKPFRPHFLVGVKLHPPSLSLCTPPPPSP